MHNILMKSSINIALGWANIIMGTKSVVLYSQTCPNQKTKRISKAIGFRYVSDIDYLVIPLAICQLVACNFNNILNSASSKEISWGQHNLSHAGRVTLIRTTLLAILIYLISLTLVLRGNFTTIKKITHHFIWQKGRKYRGMHYVAWSKLCQSISLGGLGFNSSGQWVGPTLGQTSI